ncbi:WRKY domain-containing protein [Artemisia annua]|uniref:WRKY domain-containing protein n=1 Tax=Artemisia annua TaxID=35608 RepID=A0A2U1LKT9_ARTAN|nr:WRKY domain-containing protein [Artemisia annua]
MESFSGLESSPSNQIESIQELTHVQQWTDNIFEMPWLSENIEVDHATINRVAVERLEMFSITPSIKSNYNGAVNDTSPLYSLDGWSSKDVKMVKPVKPIKSKRGCYIRRSSWTSTNITSYTDDGHSWRKYGQKEIINATHKRNYYRCSHKFDQGCQATKQVQKIEDEPPKYKITYNRHHTCKNFLSTPQIFLDSTDDNDTSVLLSFENNGPSFSLDKHEEPNNGFSSLDSSYNQTSSFDYNVSHNLIMSDSSWPVSQTSSRLDLEEVILTRVYSPI